MTLAELTALEEALWRAARAQLPSRVLAEPALRVAVVDRSERYTSRRAELGLGAADPRDLAARALFFTVADAAKIAVPLAELAGRDALPRGAPLTVLDLGAGCGAMSLGVIAALARGPGPGRTIAITAIDRDGPALELLAAAARDLAAALGVDLTITPRKAEVADPLPAGRFDLVVAGHLLNELDPAGHAQLARRMVAATAPGGATIWIEPALRETARALHEVRDGLLAAKVGHVFAPCTRTVGGCPALLDPDDWCHEDRPLVLPPRARRMSQATGLRDGGMRFAYLVVRPTALALVATPPGRVALRVVSQSQRTKGQRQVFLCGDEGRIQARLLSRNRTEANRLFERAARGDVLVLAADAPRDLQRDDEVDRVRPATPSARD